MIYADVYEPTSFETSEIKINDYNENIGKIDIKNNNDCFKWYFCRIPPDKNRDFLKIDISGPDSYGTTGNFIQVSRIALVPENIFHEKIKEVNNLISEKEVIFVN